MLFITNRFPNGSTETIIGRPFEFDLKNNASSISLFFCERNNNERHIEIGSQDFLSRLKNSKYRQILLYIHGFSNLPSDIFKTALKLQKFFDQKKENEILVVPLIWPCDNDIGIIKDYWDDQGSADASGRAFSRALGKFITWREKDSEEKTSDPCLKRINVLAHSMGNRVLRESLNLWNKDYLHTGVPLIFRNTFLVAADIENESIHRNGSGKLINDASRNVVVYFASDDLALRASKAANLKNKIASRRLGHTGPENMELTPHNVYIVDCDDVNNSYDYPKGHSYFHSGKESDKPGLVFEHIYNCLKTGRVFPEDDFRRSSIIREK